MDISSTSHKGLLQKTTKVDVATKQVRIVFIITKSTHYMQLHDAVKRGDSTDKCTVQKLLLHGADPNAIVVSHVTYYHTQCITANISHSDTLIFKLATSTAFH